MAKCLPTIHSTLLPNIHDPVGDLGVLSSKQNKTNKKIQTCDSISWSWGQVMWHRSSQWNVSRSQAQISDNYNYIFSWNKHYSLLCTPLRNSWTQCLGLYHNSYQVIWRKSWENFKDLYSDHSRCGTNASNASDLQTYMRKITRVFWNQHN